MNRLRTGARVWREFARARNTGSGDPALQARALRRLEAIGRRSVETALPCALLRLQAQQPALLPLLAVAVFGSLSLGG